MKHTPTPTPTELRQRAEDKLASRPTDSRKTQPGDTERLLHELQVHQIELEMQNEELQQARARADALLAQYTDLYDFAPAGYLTLDREGAIRQVNLTGACLLGVERSKLANRRFGQFVAEGDRRAFSDFLEKVFASEAKTSCEVTLPQDGSLPLVVRIEGRRTEDEQECRAVISDITAEKQAEEARRANATLLEIAGRTARFGGWSVNLAENRCAWSDEVAAIHEIPADYSPTVEKGIGLYAPEWRERIMEVFTACAREGKPYDEELEIITAKGRRVWVRTLGEAVRDDSGTIAKVQGSFQDITERKLAEEKTKQQLDELRRWHEVTLGREERVQELKREVNELLTRAGEKERYGGGIREERAE